MSNAGTKRVLVVDDEKPIRQLLARIAQRAGFEVDTAKDGVEALEMLASKRYAIAIVDLMMPRLSGYELVEAISKLDPRPIVLVATAMANGDVASLDDSMVRRVIKKPFDIDALAKALVECANQVADERALADEPVPEAPPEVAKIPVAALDPDPPAEIRVDDGEGSKPAVEEPPAEDRR